MSWTEWGGLFPTVGYSHNGFFDAVGPMLVRPHDMCMRYVLLLRASTITYFSSIAVPALAGDYIWRWLLGTGPAVRCHIDTSIHNEVVVVACQGCGILNYLQSGSLLTFCHAVL